ncbi:hypothetical protein EDM56_28410 [Brevibacillus fluminis]|uniref:TolC family protein n=1 Tax=Brevibacillus fluminis TaxID=511487 RepID=A0A3M8CVU1_9BACL|nr:TolC family protein [Brevibacillus fluminis]RNB79738.1 hypothetical protein EDM56_28410 [Brevibacillus fluminis]
MKKKTALIASIMTVMLVCSQAKGIALAKPEPELLTVRKAQEMAIANSEDVKIEKLNGSNVALKNQLAVWNSRLIKEENVESLNMALAKSGPKSAAPMTEQQQTQMINKVISSKKEEVAKRYYELWNSAKKLEIAEESENRLTDLKELSSRLGKREDQLQVENQIAQQEASKQVLLMEYSNSITLFNTLIGAEVDNEWTLTGDLPEDAKLPVTLEEFIRNTLDHTDEYVTQKITNEYLKKIRDIHDKYSALSTNQGRISVNNEKIGQLYLEKIRKKVRNDIVIEYRKYVELKEVIAKYKESVATSEKYYIHLKKLYMDREVPMNDVLSAENTLTNLEFQLRKGMNEYNLIVSKLY